MIDIESLLTELESQLPDTYADISLAKWFDENRSTSLYKQIVFYSKNMKRVSNYIRTSYLYWWMDGISEDPHPFDMFLAVLLMIMHDAGRDVSDLSRQACRSPTHYWTKQVALQCILSKQLNDSIRIAS